MSDKEAQRPGIVRAARSGKVTNAEGALALGISVRQFRRLKVADKRLGVEGLIHGNRGRPSARRLKEADRNRIVELINGRYAGLNDCHLTEKLRELEKLEISRETVRQIRLAEHIAPVRRRRAPPHRSRRLRQAREGAMVLIDASQHLWLEERGPLWNLLGALDDATGKILVLHFRQHEDLHGYTKLLRRLTTHGLPCALYGDRLSVFVRNDDHWSLEEQLAGEQTPTQFGLMLAELAIGYITAHSPQAKGRIERLWETLQDRLVAELRLRGIDTIEEAEAYLPEFIRDYNQRFARTSREPAVAWRVAPRPIEPILSCRYDRVVAKDNTVTLPGRWIQLPPRGSGRSWQGCRVEARELIDGRLLVFHRDTLIAEQPWPQPTPFTLVQRNASPKRRAQLGIDLPESSRIDDRLAVRVRTRPRKTGIGQFTKIRRPKPNHPWKQNSTLNAPEKSIGARGT